MNKIARTLLILLFLASFGYSQNDPAAEKILKAMKSDYDSYSAIEVDFDLEIEIPERAIEKQTGKIIQAGKNYHVDMDEQSIYCDGSSLWLHLKDNNEVQINDFEEDAGESMMSPKDILKIYESGEYEYGLTNEQREEGIFVQQIEFKPTDADSEYSKVRLTFTPKDNKIKRVKIFSKDGSRFTMKVKKQKINGSYGADLFVFDAKKFPGIHIEDLRL